MYDILIVGGGPAGLTAAIYGLRAGKKVALFEKFNIGGQTALTFDIENYPGFKKIDGIELTQIMLDQAISLGLEVFYDDVAKYNVEGKIKKIITSKSEFEGKTVILCLGAAVRELNVTNEREFLGKGVSYCATCDGNFFKDKIVAVVGGGNTSLQDVLYLADICKKVYLIHRRDEFRGDEITAGKILTLKKTNPDKLELVLCSEVISINGKDRVESINVKNKKTDEISSIKIDGIFIAVGRKPDTDNLVGIVELNKKGYIVTDEHMNTSLEGVFAAGDVRNTPLKQIVTACSDGAIAAVYANDYINQD